MFRLLSHSLKKAKTAKAFAAQAVGCPPAAPPWSLPRNPPVAALQITFCPPPLGSQGRKSQNRLRSAPHAAALNRD